MEEFLQEYVDNFGPLDEVLMMQDDQNNNFMHYLECKYAPKFWLKFIEDENEQNLANITRKLLKLKNNSNLTPIQELLN